MPARRPQLALFVLVLGAYAYFYQAGGWNQNSRFDLTRAIVERHTLAIDAFHENTGDKAFRDGHWYTDKAPGLSLLAVPAYAVVHAIAPGAVVAGSYLGTLFAVGLPSACAAVALFSMGRRVGLGSAWSAAIALAYALATLAFPYATIFYGHQTAAALGVCAFALAWARRGLVAAGLLLGLAVCVDYTALILAGAIVLYAAVRIAWRATLRVIAGGVPMAIALAAYHAAAFGHPFALPYEFVLQEHRRMGWFMGIGAPEMSVAWGLLFGAYRGLFYGAPWLIAGLPGLVFLHRQGHRAEAALCASVFAAYWLMNAGLVDWAGGWAMGPRYLIPAIPFLAVGAMGMVAATAAGSRGRRATAFVGGAAVTVSALLMLAGTAVRPDVPLTIERPFTQFILPAFAHGNLARSNHPIDGEGVSGVRAAWNLGQRVGLERWASLAPLAGWLALTGWWLVRSIRDAERPRAAGRV